MDRRRAAGLLLALAACFATANAAPTASNHTALDLYDVAPDGCYYNFQHYGEGDRIMTNEPCLNCTCHNRMLMCYLRVCPFTKPIGQDCTIEKRADQCCPIVTCPDVPVDLLTSTTTSPAEYGSTGIGKLDKFGCSINGKYFSEGSKVPPTPNKPCEHCYCIRNMTTCVMQECTLHVDGCTPIYHKDVCCPVRYSCDHPEDEMPLLDDLSTTVRPTPGFLLTTTTISPVTQMSQDCVYDNRIFPDGALIKTEKACDHCYCMKGDIVCVVQECGTPMENEGKNCTALSPREGVCCPDTYICDGDESSTGTYEADGLTTHAGQEILTTLSPPRRTISEGSGYRNEPDEVTHTEPSLLEPEIEGSGEDEEPKQPIEIITDKPKLGLTDDILAITEETHEFIPLTTVKPKEAEETNVEIGKEDESLTTIGSIDKTTESQQYLPSSTDFYSTKDFEEPITDKTEDIGSGELPEDEGLKPQKEMSVTSILPTSEENIATTEIYKQNIITSATEPESLEPETPVTSAPSQKEEKTDTPLEPDADINEISDVTTSISIIEHDVATAAIPIVEQGTKTSDSTESSKISEQSTTKDLETSNLTTLRTPITEENIKEPTIPADQNVITSALEDFTTEDHLETQYYTSSTSAPSLDNEFVTTEAQELATDRTKETEYFKPQHVTASTPMLEEIEKDTTEYYGSEKIIPNSATQDTFSILSSTIPNVPAPENDKEATESSISEEYITEDYLPGTTNIPISDQQEKTTARYEKIPETPIDTSIQESSKPEEHSPATTTSDLSDYEKKTTPNLETIISEFDTKKDDSDSSTTAPTLETEEPTTEPDKGLNTIPSEGIDDEIPVSQEEQKHSTAEEKITTVADLANRITTDTGDILSSTISDTSIFKEEKPSLTTESAFRKEDYSPTEAQISPKSTTVTADVTEEVISTLTHDHTTIPEREHETTLVPKYTESIQVTTLAQEISDVSNYEPVTTEDSISEFATEKSTTSIPLHEKETTTANQEDNEIFNEPRIPGEGDCLLNGVTYTNESAVPSTDKCQSGCKCVSSIIKCDPIICSPPPAYMDNCETMYDTPDACCPTYICDHKTETIPPQSHSQMSGTEAPVMSPVHCHGDECEINKDQKQHGEHSDACKSGTCTGSSDDSKESTGYPHSDSIPEKPKIVESVECIGEECKQVLCTNENGCQAISVKPCEGENCDDVISPATQQCKDCAVSSVPPKECNAGEECDASSTQQEHSHPTQICTGKDGCSNVPQLPEDECKEDHCRRKGTTGDSPTDQSVGEPCTAPDCKSTQTHVEVPNVPVIDQTAQSVDDGNKKDFTETTEKLETDTESLELATKQPEFTRDESSSTISAIIDLVTEPKSETTTKAAEYTDEQLTSGDFVTEENEPLLTESPEYYSSASTETTKKDSNEDISPSISGVEVEMTDKSATQEDIIGTNRPQEFITTESSTSAKTSDLTEATSVYTIEAQNPTEMSEKPKPEDEAAGTETSLPFTKESYETIKPLVDMKDEMSTDSSTEPPISEVDVKKPTTLDHADTTITLTQESSTEPSRTFATESDRVTLEETGPVKSTDSFKYEKSTEKVPQSTTEPSVIETDGQVTEIDHTKTETSEYEITTVSAVNQGTTVSKTSDTTHFLGETEREGIPSEITEKTITESSKPFATESLEITTTSQNIYQEATTQKVLESTSTEPSSYYNEEQDKIVSPQESEKTTPTEYEIVTVPPKTQTNAQSDAATERDGITIPITETTQSFTTESKIPEDIYNEKTTSEVSEESSSDPSKFKDTTDTPITQSSEKTDLKESTPSIYEEASETSSTDSQIISEKVDQPTTSEIPEKYSTQSIKVHPIDHQEVDKPIGIEHDTTKDNVLDEFVTEPPKLFDTEPDIPQLPEKDTTLKVSQATEVPLSYITESQDASKSSEEYGTTTVITTTESAEPSRVEDEVKHEKPITVTPLVEPEIPVTSQFASTSDELTTPSSTSGSRLTTQQEGISKETKDTTTSEFGSTLTQTDGAIETESSLKEKVSTTPEQKDHDIAITATPLFSDSDQTQYAESTPKSIEQETQNQDIETHTVSSPPDLETTNQPKETAVSEKEEVPQETDNEIQVPANVSTESDELRTTSSEIHDLTTPSVEASTLLLDVEIKTENPELSYTPQQEQNTEKIHVVSQDMATEEISTSTEQPSSPQIHEGYDSTKTYPDDHTMKPIQNDSKEPEKPIDHLIQSLITEQYETVTKLSDFDTDSHTQTPLHISSATPEDGVKQTPQEYDVKDELSTTATGYNKPVRTESPVHIDKTESETTTQKKYLLEDDIVTQEPSIPEENVVITSKTTTDQFATERTDTPMIYVTPDTNAPDTTEEQELISSDKPAFEDTPTESSYTTEISDKYTESVPEVTKVPDVQIQTEKSETSLDIGISTLMPEPGKKHSELTTHEPSTESVLATQFEPTAAPKQDYAGVSSLAEDTKYTDKIDEEVTKTSVGGEFTTESTSELHTEKQGDISKTVTTVKSTSVEEFITTNKPLVPELYQTTAAVEVIDEMSTRPSALLDEESTPLSHDVEKYPHTQEQSIPVFVSSTEKSSIPVTTEMDISASKEPIQETTSLEEEFIIATSKTTIAKAEEELSTISPSSDRTVKPIDTLAEAHTTTSPEAFITLVSEGPISVVPEEPVTTPPEASVTSIPEAPIMKIPELSVSTETEVPTTKIPEVPITTEPEVPVTKAPELPITTETEMSVTKAPELPIITVPESSEAAITSAPVAPITSAPKTPADLITNAPETPEEPITNVPEIPITSAPEAPITNAPEAPVELITNAPDASEEPITNVPEAPITSAPKVPITSAPEALITSAPETSEEFITNAPEMSEEPITNVPEVPITSAPKVPITSAPEELITNAPEELITIAPEGLITNAPKTPITSAHEVPEEVITNAPDTSEADITNVPETPITSAPEAIEPPIKNAPDDTETTVTKLPEAPITSNPEMPEPFVTHAPKETEATVTEVPEQPITSAPEMPEASITDAPIATEAAVTNAPEAPIASAHKEPSEHQATEAAITNTPESLITKAPITSRPEVPETTVSSASEASITDATESPITSAPEAHITQAPELPVTAAPELPKPVSTEAQPTDEAVTPDEGSFPPSGGTSGYGQEPDYVEEDQQFGPGTCRYGGKVYVSAQQIPRDDPCDFCFCFRSDIICLQQSCPPPIHGCHEEPIQGFCCPRYECPVSMATTVNVTTTTTTTTTTLPPHFPTHSYKGSVQKRGCQIKGQTYKVGEVVRSSSGPCLHCTCGGDGQMKCDPKVCTPEPMLRQMIAAAVSAKRRR